MDTYEVMIDRYARRMYLPYKLCVLTYETNDVGSWHEVRGFHDLDEAVKFYIKMVRTDHGNMEWGIFDNEHDGPRWTNW